jgi:RND family efflux transporter MFP subunit
MNQPKPSLEELRIQRPETPPSRKSTVWILAVLLVLLLGGAGAWWFTRGKPVAVRTALARETGVSGSGDRTVLNASGYVTARRAATVSSKITGKVVEVLIEEGMAVNEGQVLARLDDSNVKTGLNLAEARLRSARAGLNETKVRIREAQQELKRQSGLMRNNIATQADFDRAEAAALAFEARLEQQEADVQVAEKDLATWQQQLDDTIIRAPFSGIVTIKNAQPGEMISPISAGGGFTRTGICTIVDMQSLEFEIDVNESYINRVKSGQGVEATLDAYPDWKIPCKVIAVIPTADRQRSTVKVRIGVESLEPRILPEMSVKVAFRESAGASATASTGVVVPAGAVRKDGGHDVVLVAGNGRVERRAVTVKSSGAAETILSSGLAPGERVVVDGPAELKDGALVRAAD